MTRPAAGARYGTGKWKSRLARPGVGVLGAAVVGLGVAPPAYADPTVNCSPNPPGAVSLAVAQTVYSTGMSMGASAKVMLAGFEAALVESNMNNCSNGHLDSVGVFQQRTWWGTYQQRTDVAYASRSFFSRAIPRENSYATAGRLAQAVQVSAFPDRYDARQAQAAELLKRVSPGADGAFVQSGGDIYRVAGGAAIYVTSAYWESLNPRPAVSQVDLSQLNQRPLDGTFIISPAAPVGRGEVYTIVGGAPVYVDLAHWDTLNPKPTVIEVDQYAIDNAGGAGVLSHLGYRPADGTVLNAAGKTYRTLAGAPILQATSSVGLPVAAAAITNAGGTGAWSHLAAPPAPPTTPVVVAETHAAVPAAVKGVSITFPKKRTARLAWPAVSGATSYKVRISARNSTKRFTAWRRLTRPAVAFTQLGKGGTYRAQIVAAGKAGTSPTITVRFRQGK